MDAAAPKRRPSTWSSRILPFSRAASGPAANTVQKTTSRQVSDRMQSLDEAVSSAMSSTARTSEDSASSQQTSPQVSATRHSVDEFGRDSPPLRTQPFSGTAKYGTDIASATSPIPDDAPSGRNDISASALGSEHSSTTQMDSTFPSSLLGSAAHDLVSPLRPSGVLVDPLDISMHDGSHHDSTEAMDFSASKDKQPNANAAQADVEASMANSSAFGSSFAQDSADPSLRQSFAVVAPPPQKNTHTSSTLSQEPHVSSSGVVPEEKITADASEVQNGSAGGQDLLPDNSMSGTLVSKPKDWASTTEGVEVSTASLSPAESFLAASSMFKKPSRSGQSPSILSIKTPPSMQEDSNVPAAASQLSPRAGEHDTGGSRAALVTSACEDQERTADGGKLRDDLHVDLLEMPGLDTSDFCMSGMSALQGSLAHSDDTGIPLSAPMAIHASAKDGVPADLAFSSDSNTSALSKYNAGGSPSNMPTRAGKSIGDTLADAALARSAASADSALTHFASFAQETEGPIPEFGLPGSVSTFEGAAGSPERHFSSYDVVGDPAGSQFSVGDSVHAHTQPAAFNTSLLRMDSLEAYAEGLADTYGHVEGESHAAEAYDPTMVNSDWLRLNEAVDKEEDSSAHAVENQHGTEASSFRSNPLWSPSSPFPDHQITQSAIEVHGAPTQVAAPASTGTGTGTAVNSFGQANASGGAAAAAAVRPGTKDASTRMGGAQGDRRSVGSSGDAGIAARARSGQAGTVPGANVILFGMNAVCQADLPTGTRARGHHTRGRGCCCPGKAMSATAASFQPLWMTLAEQHPALDMACVAAHSAQGHAFLIHEKVCPYVSAWRLM